MSFYSTLKKLLVILIVLAALTGLTITAARNYRPPAPPKPKDYGPVPAFSIDGLSTADLKSHAIVLSFFASWCAPCKLEHPVLMDLSKSATLWGVDTMDRPDDLAAFLKRAGNPFSKIAHDDSGTAGIAWGVDGIPATFVIGADGHIIYRHFGPISEDDARNEILPLTKN